MLGPFNLSITDMKTSRQANNCARAIVAHVENITGNELSMDDSLAIILMVQRAINEAKKPAMPFSRAAERAAMKEIRATKAPLCGIDA